MLFILFRLWGVVVVTTCDLRLLRAIVADYLLTPPSTGVNIRPPTLPFTVTQRRTVPHYKATVYDSTYVDSRGENPAALLCCLTFVGMPGEAV